MDKVGHFTTSYYLARMGTDMLAWSGLKNNASFFGGITASFLFLTGIEMLDGFSQEWGFSWIDLSANATGTGLLIWQKYIQHLPVGHALLRGVSSMTLKFSFSQSAVAKCHHYFRFQPQKDLHH